MEEEYDEREQETVRVFEMKPFQDSDMPGIYRNFSIARDYLFMTMFFQLVIVRDS